MTGCSSGMFIEMCPIINGVQSLRSISAEECGIEVRSV